MAGEIFISYRRSDEARARLLHDLLKDRGVEAWYDRLVPAGEDWRSATANALVKAPVFVLLFSKNAAQSDDIIKELSAATFQKKVVIPVRIEDIHPEGAFLYELASRNWFDAFTNTDARLALLADQLAALVKGGAEAQAAASKLGAQTPLAPVKPRRMSPLVMGVLGLGALVVVAGALFALNPPKKQPTLQNDRTAFFGFAADGSDIATKAASSATEETRTTLNILGLDTAAPADTQAVKLEDQLARASQLNARYALSGNVLASGDQLAVTVRLDDTQLRSTLWQATLTGGAAQHESLPVQAAARATNIVRCLIAARPGMTQEDTASLAIVTRACDTPSRFDPQFLAVWRDAARVAPQSAYAQNLAGAGYFIQAGQAASAADVQAMLEVSRQAYRRAIALDPTSPSTRASLSLLDVASDRTLADVVREVNAALGMDADRSKRQSAGDAAVLQMALLVTLGQAGDAVRVGRGDVAADPMEVTQQSTYALALHMSGQVREGRRVAELMNRRLASAEYWPRLAFMTIFDGADFASVRITAPPDTSLETIACWEDVSRAAQSSARAERLAGARRIQACLRAGNVAPGLAIATMAALGELDGAFAVFDRGLTRSNPVLLIQVGAGAYWPPAKPMRADPRFLPLMKREGIYQYWLDTGTQPDVCEAPEERDIEVCRELRKDQAK